MQFIYTIEEFILIYKKYIKYKFLKKKYQLISLQI